MEGAKRKNEPEFICPLFNFQIMDRGEDENRIFITQVRAFPFKRIDFLGNTTLNKFKKEDLKSKLLTNYVFDQHIAGAFYKKLEDMPVIEIYGEVENNLADMVEKIILSLRLFKEGDVFSKIVWSADNDYHLILSPSYEIPNTVYSNVYSLKLEEISLINLIFNKINEANFEKRRAIKIACDRFSRSYGRAMHDERIIDFMIAFEALFVKENSPNSGSIIATGCSYLLGKTDNEREEIYKFFKETYKLRNEIVHGSTMHIIDTDEIACRLKEYLRKCIMTIL